MAQVSRGTPEQVLLQVAEYMTVGGGVVGGERRETHPPEPPPEPSSVAGKRAPTARCGVSGARSTSSIGGGIALLSRRAGSGHPPPTVAVARHDASATTEGLEEEGADPHTTVPQPKRRRYITADPSRRSLEELDQGERLPMGDATINYPVHELRPGDPYIGSAGDKKRQGQEARHWLQQTGAQRYLSRRLLTSGTISSEPSGEMDQRVWPDITVESVRERVRPESRHKRRRGEYAAAKEFAEKRSKERAQRRENGRWLGRKFVCDADLLLIAERSREAQLPCGAGCDAQLIPIVVRVLQARDVAGDQLSHTARVVLERHAQVDERGRYEGRHLLPRKFVQALKAKLGRS
jgi:hypothetical protein